MKDYILAKICFDAYQEVFRLDYINEFYNLRPEFQEAWWAVAQAATQYIQSQNEKLSLGKEYDASAT